MLWGCRVWPGPLPSRSSAGAEAQGSATVLLHGNRAVQLAMENLLFFHGCLMASLEVTDREHSEKPLVVGVYLLH